MPLVRFAVKNEYSLGSQELYKDGVESEDPKAVLDGVAVAGLVGVLRQLGDLAEFAAEVFHGLQKQVASTSCRSRKLVNRVQRIEASLPSLEKAILSQTDHLRFAYAPGSEQHAYIRNERNLFISDDLPDFIMDSYEECREPPRLQRLDSFDSGGPGSCLKRYSDPTFFKRASSSSEVSHSEKPQRERKARKIKKRRSGQRSGQCPKSAPNLNGSSRMRFSSTGHGQSSLSHTGSTFDMTFKSDLGDQSDSRGSRDGVDFIECVSRPSISTQPDETKNTRLSSSVTEAEVNINGSIYIDEQTAIAMDDEPCSHAFDATVPRSSSATWDERLEIVEPTDTNYEIEDAQQVLVTNSSLHDLEFALVSEKGVDQVFDLSEQGSNPKLKADAWHLRTISDGNFMKPAGLNCGNTEVQDFLKKNIDLQEKEPPHLKSCTPVVDLSEDGKPLEPTTNGNFINDPVYRGQGTGEAQSFFEANLDVTKKELEVIESGQVSAMDGLTESDNNVRTIEWKQQESETVSAEHVSKVDAICEGGNNVNVIEWKERDIETVNPEHVSQGKVFSEGGNNLKVIEWNQPEFEIITAEQVSEMDTFSEGGNNVKVIDWNQWELEARFAENLSEAETSTEGGNRVQVIEWNQLDDIDSGTENFVDALNTIDSESESDFETEMKKGALATASKDELGENAGNGKTSESTSDFEPEHLLLSTSCDRKEGGLENSERLISDFEPEHLLLSTSCDRKEGGLENSERSTTIVSSANMWSPDCTQSSHDKSESASGQKMDVSTCLSGEQFVQTNQSATLSNVPQGLDFCSSDPAIIVKPAICEVAKSGPEAPGAERIVCAPHMSQETSVGSSTSDPVAFWTNGTLFGLAPSKPIVFSMPNSVDSGPTSNIDRAGQCSVDNVQKVDPAGKPASSVHKSEHGDKFINYGKDVGSSKHLSHQRLEKTHETSVGYDKMSDHPVIVDVSNVDVMPIESKVPRGTNVKNVPSEATGASEDTSSLLSVLSRGLLKNGLRRSVSLGYNERHESGSALKTNEIDSRCQDAVLQSVPEPNLKGKLNSPVNSPPPSPPLEHMKISFQPVDGFDKSRLKLKYPEGVDHCENSLDAFPTFQLVPESTKLQHSIGSDSDDDTFCRSYAYMSDESHSHLSDSNSEQWESGDSTESNDHTLYNGLHRISSAESASVSPQHEDANLGNIHVGPGSVTGASFGLPILDAKNPFGHQEMKLCIDPGLDSSHLQESTHEPPPLPPMQWRVSKLSFDEVEDNQDLGSDSLSQSIVPKLSNFAISQSAKADSAKLNSSTQETATISNSKKHVEDHKFGQEQTYHAEKEKGMDDKGDFLHQIRTKSFNLKRTEPTRSTYTPIPATSNKLTAILQKANAIRQAVGSDDGEDDSWSDT